MTKNYHDPIDAIRDLLNEEYECDSSEEIREDDEESELDWNQEIWVKGGGGTWQAKQLRKRLQEHCRELIKMAKEDRFSPSKAHTIYAYSDTLHDFVNGELDEPADAQESTEEAADLTLEEMNQLNEFFGRKKVKMGRGPFRDEKELGKLLQDAVKAQGGSYSTTAVGVPGRWSFKYKGVDPEDMDDAIDAVIGEPGNYHNGNMSWFAPTRKKGYRLYVLNDYYKGRRKVSIEWYKYDADFNDDL